MTIPGARQFLNEAILRAQKNEISPDQADAAILVACDELLSVAPHLLRDAFTFNTVADQLIYDLVAAASTAGKAEFRPWTLHHMRHAAAEDYRDIHGADFEFLRASAQGGATGRTTHYSFERDCDCWLKPIPDAVYTITVVYAAPIGFTTGAGTWSPWPAGVASSGTISLPDRYLRPAISLRATTLLPKALPADRIAQNLTAWERFITQQKGRGKLTGQLHKEAGDYA